MKRGDLRENALDAAFAALGPNGFLPARLPAHRLPPPFDLLDAAVAELPERYHGDGDVEPWIWALFDGEALRGASWDALDTPERDRLMTVLSVLAHCARWRRAPPRREDYERARCALPPALDRLWSALCRDRGHPRVGNLNSMVLCNFQLDGGRPGGAYEVEELVAARLRPAVGWLRAPDDEALAAFLATGVETEARGTACLRTLVELVGACAGGDRLRVLFLLERLRADLASLGEPFKRNIQRGHLRPGQFLTLIQPTTIWGLDEGEGPLEGASGPQVGCLQALDALLGVSAASPMGRSVRHSRRYLPKVHQDFLEVVDTRAGRLRGFVAASGDGRLVGELNACVLALRNWRLVHKARGASYLRGDPGEEPSGYTSTGGVVPLDTDRVALFEAQMDQRVQESTAACVPAPEAQNSSEAWRRYLGPEDRERIREVGWRRPFQAGELLLSEGTRGAGLWLVERGRVRVRAGELDLGELGAEQIFGEMSFLESGAASADVVGTDEGELLHLRPEDVFALTERDNGLGLRFYQFLAALLARRLRQMDTRATHPGPIQGPIGE
ncbi:MAG: cyclic nucleotide-binding domain-containing protein [Deltaproteobacteria bacterium]|nr:cyclic nucleotide-binding domain-containing protein [Deltaproteobacteria bacterium]